jgi:hypothetical protein
VANILLFRYLLVFILLIPAFTGHASAAGNLNFTSEITDRQRLVIDRYFKDTLHTPAANPIALALADLNEDGLNEFILQSDCKEGQKGYCSFTILAETDNKVISLGSITGWVIELGNAYSNGVRNIIARQNPRNDFDRTVYVWEPQTARYMIKE